MARAPVVPGLRSMGRQSLDNLRFKRMRAWNIQEFTLWSHCTAVIRR